jgi:hypothetical protein
MLDKTSLDKMMFLRFRWNIVRRNIIRRNVVRRTDVVPYNYKSFQLFGVEFRSTKIVISAAFKERKVWALPEKNHSNTQFHSSISELGTFLPGDQTSLWENGPTVHSPNHFFVKIINNWFSRGKKEYNMRVTSIIFKKMPKNQPLNGRKFA